MMASIGQFAINPLIFSAPGYDAAKGLPAGHPGHPVPNVLVVNAASKLDSLQDLIKLAQAQPGVTYASSGNGSFNHLAGALLAHMANIDMLHIPIRVPRPGCRRCTAAMCKSCSTTSRRRCRMSRAANCAHWA